MRALLAVFCSAVLLPALAGCAPTGGNILDWQEKSFARVLTGTARNGLEDLAFATEVDADGIAKREVVQEYPIQVRGVAEQATVSLRSMRDFKAAIWFRGFEAGKLVVNQASLTDNREHMFMLRSVAPSYDCAAELAISPRENANWLEFNNRSYHLTLIIKFTYDGKLMTASFPKIYCVFEKPFGS